MAIKVVVAGATGKTGRVITRGIAETSDLRLVGAVAPHHAGRTLASVLNLPAHRMKIAADVDSALDMWPADVLVDFSTPDSGAANALAALAHGVRPVIGTTGLQAGDLDRIDREARARGLAALMAANFSIGALVLEHLVTQAAALMPMVEVVELHHVQKKDAPSGTAARLAAQLEGAGARAPVPVHSVRLPGYVAHHEVIFGGQGEVLTLRHDAMAREAFVPGVLVAVRAVMQARAGLATDLWPLLDSGSPPS